MSTVGNNVGLLQTSPSSMFQGTLVEILLICTLFLGICYAKWKWNPKQMNASQKKEFHLILEAFWKYTMVYFGVALGLKYYSVDMAKAFIGTGLYHAAYTLHSFVAYRDN
jgi:hypothetical protein